MLSENRFNLDALLNAEDADVDNRFLSVLNQEVGKNKIVTTIQYRTTF